MLNQQLFDAIEARDREQVESLLCSGGNANARHPAPSPSPGFPDMSALREAVENDDADILHVLLAHGADPNQDYALLMAANEGLTEMVQLLLRYGANPDMTDDEGGTPLSDSAREGHKEIVRALIAAGANLDLSGGQGDTSTPLERAGRSGHVEIVALLIEAGADVNAQVDYSSTPLDGVYIRAAFRPPETPTLAANLRAVVKMMRNAGGVQVITSPDRAPFLNADDSG